MRVPIQHCDAETCAYNEHDQCHAVTVEIGKEAARCELFTRSVMFNVAPRFNSQVSACRMSRCASNRLGGCTREEIAIKKQGEGASCSKYVNRMNTISKNNG